jgi:hypothetical protein
LREGAPKRRGQPDSCSQLEQGAATRAIEFHAEFSQVDS